MAFVKYIGPEYYENTLVEKPIEQIKVSSKGLIGADRRALEKRAGKLFDYDKIVSELKPGEIPIHVIALGCDEIYGPNRNGDTFSKEACKKFHNTFVKLGHWFRNHKHDDPKKSYGIVKASAYNELEGRIELIAALNGTKEAARANDGKVATEEMNLLASERDLPVSMACVADPRLPVLTSAGYRPIADVMTGDIVLTHAGQWRMVVETVRRTYSGDLYYIRTDATPYTLVLTEDHPLLARISYSKEGRMCKWVQTKDLKVGDVLASPTKIPESVESPSSSKIEILAKLYVAIKKNKKTVEIIAGGNPTDIQRKHIPYIDELLESEFITNICKSVQLAYAGPSKILAALLQSFSTSGIRQLVYNIFNFANKQTDILYFEDLYFALWWKLLLAVCGVPSEIVPAGTRYKCKISRKNLNNIKQNKFPPYYSGSYTPDAKIISIDKIRVESCTVYNLEVSVDNSYILGGIISHNCKVAFDECSGCGNHARNRTEYCGPDKCTKYGGLRDNLGKTFEDGHILRAFNPEPNFFDISLVNTPADRIAYTLGVIKTSNHRVPNWTYGIKTAEDIKTQLEHLKKLALEEYKFNQIGKTSENLAFNPVIFNGGTKVAQLTKEFDIPEITSALVEREAILPIEDFLQCMGDFEPEHAKQAARQIRTILPNIFNKMLEDDNILNDIKENVFYPTENNEKNNIIIEKVAENLKLNPKSVELRKEAALRKGLTKTAYYIPSDADNIYKAAKFYGLYQLASASKWKGYPVHRYIVNMNNI